MPFDVNEFRAEMVNDGARPNRFQVNLTLPATGFANFGGATNVTRKLSFMCRSSQLPGTTSGVTVTNYFGREVKLAGDATYPEWTVTVYNDEDFVVRNSMEKWMNGINGHRSNLRLPQARNNLQYTSDAVVSQYAKTGETVKEYKFIGLFPIDISPIDLDWASNDVVEEFTVTFAYQWWDSVGDNVTS